MLKGAKNKVEFSQFPDSTCISVVITYFNKAYEIGLILESLIHQTIAITAFEIVIIDDGSEKSIEDLIFKYRELGLNIIYKKINHTGNRAYNRSLAASLSLGEYLIFLDADMIPDSTFIYRHYENLTKNDNVVSLGYRNLLYPFPQELITDDTVRNKFYVIENLPCQLDERIPLIYAHSKTGLDLSKAWFMAYSHNIALKRSLYNSVAGFDENFRFGWGVEDVDFAYQLYKKGANFIYDSNINLYHVPHSVESNVQERYQKNLLYFYNKHKSYETEIFQIHHLMDPVSLCNLYKIIGSKKHLGKVDSDYFSEYKNCLFIGFNNATKVLKENGNVLISTDLSIADYSLIGLRLPFEDNQFNEVVLSCSYDVFLTELLYRIIKELLRVGKSIRVYNDNATISLDDFWKRKTNYSFNEFCEIKKVRVVTTLSSESRYDNVLYTELVKALNKNGVYASLEISNDEMKDLGYLFPIGVNSDSEIETYYKRNLSLLSENIVSVIDKPNRGNIKGNNESLIWWGDVPFYNQNLKEFINKKKGFNKVLVRNEDSDFKPGIDSESINNYLKNNKLEDRPMGIVIVDLMLKNLEQILSVIQELKFSETQNFIVPISIVSFAPVLEEFKISKTNNLYFPERFCKQQIEYLENYHNVFFKRFNKLCNYIKYSENCFMYTTNGELEEVDKIIQRNSIYIDFTSTREINPYVLQAAAYGLNVFTVSPEYKTYNYKNIIDVEYKTASIISDIDINNANFYLATCNKRILESHKLVKKIKTSKLQTINTEILLQTNIINDWKYVCSKIK